MSPALSPTSLCFCFFSPCKWFGGGSGAMESISVPARHAISPTNGRSLQNPRKQPSFVSIIPTTHKTGKFLIPYGGHRSPFCSIVNNYEQSDFQGNNSLYRPSHVFLNY
uniref:Uncharacterized protein n=1 Tax=Rhizophora mucronata TaxID=61149 RepID=A0A2P2J8V9_RHIMU